MTDNKIIGTIILFVMVVAGAGVYEYAGDDTYLRHSLALSLVEETNYSTNWTVIDTSPSRVEFVRYSSLCKYDYLRIDKDDGITSKCGNSIVNQFDWIYEYEKDGAWKKNNKKSTGIVFDRSQLEKLIVVISTPYKKGASGSDGVLNITVFLNSSSYWVDFNTTVVDNDKHRIGFRELQVSKKSKFDPGTDKYKGKENNVYYYGEISGPINVDPVSDFPDKFDCLWNTHEGNPVVRVHERANTVYYFNSSCDMIQDWNNTILFDWFTNETQPGNLVQDVIQKVDYIGDWHMVNRSYKIFYNATCNYTYSFNCTHEAVLNNSCTPAQEGTVVNRTIFFNCTKYNTSWHMVNESIGWLNLNSTDELDISKEFKYDISGLMVEEGTAENIVCLQALSTGDEVCYPEEEQWNASTWTYIATPNISAVNNNSQIILWLKGCNCSSTFSSGNISCDSSMAGNASCYYNMCTELMNASEDCSDIQVYDSNTNTTVPFVPLINVTGASELGNDTGEANDSLGWDAILIQSPNWNQSINLSANIKISTNGTSTYPTTNAGANVNNIFSVGWYGSIGSEGINDVLGGYSGNDAVIVGTPTWNNDCGYLNGGKGDCYEYDDGALEYIHYDNPFPDNNHTMCVQFNLDDQPVSNYDAIFYMWDGVTSARLSCETDDDLYYFVEGNNIHTCGNAVITDGCLPHGTWHHFCWTVDTTAQEMKIYLDGELNATDASCTATNFDATALEFPVGNIYNHNADFGWDGKIGAMNFWDRVLTEDEIRGIANEGSHIPFYWNATAITPPTPPANVTNATFEFCDNVTFYFTPNWSYFNKTTGKLSQPETLANGTTTCSLNISNFGSTSINWTFNATVDSSHLLYLQNTSVNITINQTNQTICEIPATTSLLYNLSGRFLNATGSLTSAYNYSFYEVN